MLLVSSFLIADSTVDWHIRTYVILGLIHGITHRVYPFLNPELPSGYDDEVTISVDICVHALQGLLVLYSFVHYWKIHSKVTKIL
jgi:hypothetical protein